MEKRQESLIEHLEALRSTLIKCFAALGIGLLPMFLAAPDCIDLLIRIMTSGNNISLNYFSPMEVFVLQIKTAVVLDILICSPYIAKNIWEFVLPALHNNERRFIRSIVLSSCILFIFGALFCVFFYPAPAGKFRLEFCHTEHKSRFWRFRHHFNRTLAVGSFRADVSVSADYPLANSFRYRFLPLRNRQTSAHHRRHFASGRSADTARHCQPANACRSDLCTF